MKLSRIAFAVASLAAAVSASAAPLGPADTVMYVTGSSATGINVAKSLNTLCNTATGSLSIFKTDTTLDRLGNVWTAVCSKPFINGVLTEVRVNTAGSASAITAANGTGTARQYIESTSGSTALAAGTGSLSFFAAGQLNTVTSANLGAASNTKSNGGFSDVEPAMFTALGLGGLGGVTTAPTNYLQAFGLAVSTNLYSLLQAYQAAKGTLPLTDAQGNVCATVSGTTYTATGSTAPGCQPSISKAQAAAYLSSTNSLAKRAGVNFLLGAVSNVQTSDLPAGTVLAPVAVPAAATKVAYVRRDNSSGTYACSTNHFLNNPIGGTTTVGGSLGAGGSNTTGTVQNIGTSFAFYTATGSGDAAAKLTTPSGITGLTSGFAIGSLGTENNPIGTADTYRFVKVDNNWIAEGTATTAVPAPGQTSEAIAGRYNFVCELVKYADGATAQAAFDTIEGALAAGTSSPGLFLGTESAFSKGKVQKNTQPYGVYRTTF